MAFTQNQMNWLRKNCVRPHSNRFSKLTFDGYYITIANIEYKIEFCADSTEIYGIAVGEESLEADLPDEEYAEFCQNLFNTIPGESNYE